MPVTAIIPAYNEENTIASVVNAIKTVHAVDQIIVVSDGSSDKTALYARRCGVTVIELSRNRGKSAAIQAGLERCGNSIVLLLDADLVGLTGTHAESLIRPVLQDQADMTVGIFSKGRLVTDLAQKISPQLSGQRAIRKEILEKVTGIGYAGYGIEIALTLHGEKENIRVETVELGDLTHITKEEKYGLFKGFGKRLHMYWQVYKGFRLAKKT